MRAIRLLAFLIFAGAAAFAILPSNPARATPVALAPLVPSASPEPGGLIQPVYWHRYYWHRHYWHRHYWHRHYYHRYYYHRVYWRRPYYHHYGWRRHYWHRHYWHRRYWRRW